MYTTLYERLITLLPFIDEALSVVSVFFTPIGEWGLPEDVPQLLHTLLSGFQSIIATMLGENVTLASVMFGFGLLWLVVISIIKWAVDIVT